MKVLPAGSKTFKRELLKVRETNAGFQHVNQVLALPSSKGLDLSQFIKEIRILSRDEKKQEDMRVALNDHKTKFYIGDVRDFNSIND